MKVQTGIGLDIHALEPGEGLMVGGLLIPASVRSVGHSDGDALIHALVDALLGAAGLGDIGTFFSSDDPAWKNAPSEIFLQDAVKKVRSAGFRIDHVDATVILQQPRLQDATASIRENLARLLGVETGNVSVKATTTDHL
ncbi:MAG: 2-C-methyl-D-erythritol 2,4-cyclodiphosphate synthase, partial [Candidatus Neomarinimicrobiota bacterium]